jgi:CheY-like chemotaxis protein
MTPEVRARIFEPFFTTKEFGQGTGLGLAMVFGIVKAHSGWIRVEATPGQGSLFQIFLPAVETLCLAATDVVRPPIRGGHESILIVDDEEMIRKLARAVLERWGFHVLTAADGEEAIAIYREKGNEIDLILLDYTMPRLNGLEVLRHLQRLNPSVRVIFSSGHTQESDMEQLLTAGARAFVAKPYKPENLVERIRQVLDEPEKVLDEPVHVNGHCNGAAH